MYDLIALTEKAFAENGPLACALAARGRTYAVNRKQIDYAVLSAKAIAGDEDARCLITLLEGETGTGKSLGYLIPLCLHLAMSGRKGLISTYTLHLQRQIITREFDAAAAVTKTMTGVTLTAAPRKGIRNFISRARVLDLIAALSADNILPAEGLAALENLADHPTGDIAEWLETNTLPPTVRIEDICLLPGAGEAETAAYRQHIQASKDADVAVVTHAMLMMSCQRWHATLATDDSDNPFDVAVIDEADRIPSAAESVFNSRVSMPMLTRIADTLEAFGSRNLKSSIEQASSWVDARFAELSKSHGLAFHHEGAGGYVVLTDPRADPIRIAAKQHAERLSADITKGAIIAAKAGLPPDDVAELRSIAAELADFCDACEFPGSDRSAPVLRWSPVRSYGALAVVPLWPGRLSGRLWKEGKDGKPPFLRSIIMTSATLDAPGERNRFFGFRDLVGINPRYHNYNDEGSASIAPDRFGSMTFVLADRAVPAPGTDGDQSNPAWIAYAAQGVAAAKSRGGRSLVLLPSYRDCGAIASAARALGVSIIEQKPGDRLSEVLPSFLADENATLITPGAWEGLDLPGMISHVIIPRIPYPALDNAKNAALLDAFAAKSYSPDKAKSIIFAYASNDARRKLKQGVGRGVRSATDSVTLWLLDPRFPLPESITSNRRLKQSNSAVSAYIPLAACIPERFRSGISETYSTAEILPFAAGSEKAA